MAKTKRLIRSFYRLLFPVVLLVCAALITASVMLVRDISNPPRNSYLLTPEQYGRLSARGAQVTDETWANPDGTIARGWLLRGAENAPAVILLHSYGADRSNMLNLGVKLSEMTNFTVLMPDLRGHGLDPKVNSSTFGGSEADDIVSAVQFLRGLKIGGEVDLVGSNIGVYGVELGGLTAIKAAGMEESIKSLVLDSVPTSSDKILESAVRKRFPFASSLTSRLAEQGANLFFLQSNYDHRPACQSAQTISNREIFLLGGADNEALRDSTEDLTKCFSQTNKIETKFDLNPSGFNIGNASNDQSNTYDQRIIDFFQQTLDPTKEQPVDAPTVISENNQSSE